MLGMCSTTRTIFLAHGGLWTWLSLVTIEGLYWVYDMIKFSRNGWRDVKVGLRTQLENSSIRLGVNDHDLKSWQKKAQRTKILRINQGYVDSLATRCWGQVLGHRTCLEADEKHFLFLYCQRWSESFLYFPIRMEEHPMLLEVFLRCVC